MGLGIGLEELALLRLGNARPRIPHGEAETGPLLPCLKHAALALALHLQADLAGFGEFDGIAEQVEEHLLEPVGVTSQGHRQITLEINGELQPLFPGVGGQQEYGTFHRFRQIEGHRIHRQLAGFDLGKVQHVVEHVEQSFPGTQGRLGHALLIAG